MTVMSALHDGADAAHFFQGAVAAQFRSASTHPSIVKASPSTDLLSLPPAPSDREDDAVVQRSCSPTATSATAHTLSAIFVSA